MSFLSQSKLLQPYADNPIIDGDSIFGHGWRTEDFIVAHVDDKHYAGVSSGTKLETMDIYILESSKLLEPYRKVQADPVLGRGDVGEWDEEYLRIGAFFPWGNDWYLFYSGQASDKRLRIGAAKTSKKDFPFSWEKLPDNPLLSPSPNQWDSKQVSQPGIAEWNNSLIMHYSGYDGFNRQIGLALAPKPEGSWIKCLANPIIWKGKFGSWNRNRANPKLIRVGDKFYGVYEAMGFRPPWRVGSYSFSHPCSQIVLGSEPLVDARDGENVANPSLYYEDDVLYLWVGSTENGRWRYVKLFTNACT